MVTLLTQLPQLGEDGFVAERCEPFVARSRGSKFAKCAKPWGFDWAPGFAKLLTKHKRESN